MHSLGFSYLVYYRSQNNSSTASLRIFYFLLPLVVMSVWFSLTTSAEIYPPLQVFSEGAIRCAAVSSNGKYLATGSKSGWATLWNTETGIILRRFTGHTNSVETLAFSEDGNKLVTGSWDKTAKVWDVATGQLINTFGEHLKEVNAVDISPDGEFIVSGESFTDLYLDTGEVIQGTAKIWNVSSGELLHVLEQHTGSVNAVDYSTDGSMIATCSIGYASFTDPKGSYVSGVANVWNASTGDLIHQFNEFTDKVNFVTFSPDGSTLLTLEESGRIVLWNLETYQSDTIIPSGHFNNSPNSITVSAKISEDRDSSRNRLQRDSTQYPYAVRFTPDGTKLLVGSKNETAYLLDIQTRNIEQQYIGHTGYIVIPAGFSKNGNECLTWSTDMKIKSWEVNSGTEQLIFHGHLGENLVFDVSPDGMLLAIADSKEIQIRDPKSGEIRQRILTNSWRQPVAQFIFFTNDNHLLAGTSEELTKWKLQTNEEEITFEEIFTFQWSANTGHNAESFAINTDGTRLITGGYDMTARLWDLTNQSEKFNVVHDSAVTAVAFSPDNKMLLTGTEWGDITLWDVETGEYIDSWNGHSFFVKSLSMNREMNRILSGSWDATTKLWDLENNKVKTETVVTFEHPDFVTSSSISLDGKRVLTGCEDGIARIWDIETQTVLRTFGTKAEGSINVTFSNDYRNIIGSHNGTIWLWEIDEPRVLIVSGRKHDLKDSIIPQTHALAKTLYWMCMKRGYQKEDVQWLSAIPPVIEYSDFKHEYFNQDADSDGKSDVSDIASEDTIKNAINWGDKDLISPGRRFLIYLIDHGSEQDTSDEKNVIEYFFLIDEERLSATELDSWLDASTVDNDVTLIVETCYSGGFVQKCTPQNQSKRMVIASSSAVQPSIILGPPSLTSFSSLFWDAAYMGASIKESFNIASSYLTSSLILNKDVMQEPQIDDNSDGIMTMGVDGNNMGRNFFGRSWIYAGHSQGNLIAIESVLPPVTDPDNNKVELIATMIPGIKPKEVQAIIRPPSAATVNETENPEISIISLKQDDDNTRLWSAPSGELKEKGIYSVSFTAHLDHGWRSRPRTTTIQIGSEISEDDKRINRALLVGGGWPEYSNFVSEVITNIEETCVDRGFLDNNINIIGRDFSITTDEFYKRLDDIVQVEDTSNPMRLFLYLIGKGEQDGTLELSPGNILSATNVILKLNDIQSNNSNLEVLLVVESDYSGLFAYANRLDSSDRRIVISSTEPSKECFMNYRELYHLFSWNLFHIARQGDNLYNSYDYCKAKYTDTYKSTVPILDENGDGKYDKDDNKSRTWYFGKKGVFAGEDDEALPAIISVSDFPEPVTSPTFRVQVKLVQSIAPQKVWITIIPYLSEKISSVQKLEIELFRENDSWIWSSEIGKDALHKNGDYLLLYQAEYYKGQHAKPEAAILSYQGSENTVVENWNQYE